MSPLSPFLAALPSETMPSVPDIRSIGTFRSTLDAVTRGAYEGAMEGIYAKFDHVVGRNTSIVERVPE